MKQKKICAVCILLVCFFIPSVTYSFEGPLDVSNQFPLFMHISPPYLEKAAAENHLAVSLSHSSIYLVRSSSDWTAGLDMEITEFKLRYRRKIGNVVELGIDIPFVSFNSGFMDGFIDSYHDAFGFPDYGRSNRPQNQFLYEVRREGNLIVKGDNGSIGIGDIRLSIKRAIVNGDPAVSVRADIELPTGDAGRGFGSGDFDAGITVMLDKKFSEKFKTYWNIGFVLPGDLKAHETLDLDVFFHGGVGIEAVITEKFNILAQLFSQTSPYPDTDISAIDRTALLLAIGGRYVSGKNSLAFSFTEDPSTAGVPDFTIGLSFKRKL